MQGVSGESRGGAWRSTQGVMAAEGWHGAAKLAARQGPTELLNEKPRGAWQACQQEAPKCQLLH